MSRVCASLILAVTTFAVPSRAAAQYVIPTCSDPAVLSRSSYGVPGPCVPLVPVPPTAVPAWLQPVPTPRPVVPMPVIVAPAYQAPVYVPRVPAGGGINPWIPLAGQPVAGPSPFDLMTQLLVLQSLAAARPSPQYRAPSPPPLPAPAAPATGDGWMSAYIKGVK